MPRVDSEELATLATLAHEAKRRGEPVIELAGEVFRASGELSGWHMMKLAAAEREGDVQEALYRFERLVTNAIHPDDRDRLDIYMSARGTHLRDLQADMAQVMMTAAAQQGFGEEEQVDPTGRSDAGPSTSPPTNG